MKMKKILYVTTVSSTVNAFLVPHIKMLINDDNIVDCAFNINKPLDEELINLGVNSYNIPFSRKPLGIGNIKAFNEIIRLQRLKKYDIIHVHTPVAALYVRLLKIIFPKVKIIYTVHGYHFLEGGSKLGWLVYYPIEKVMAKLTDVIININEEDYEITKNKLKPKNCYLINGVGLDLSIYKKLSEEEILEKKNELGINKNDFVILMIAELNKNKNHKQVIYAMEILKKKYENIKIICIGEGSMKKELDKLIYSKYLHNNIIMLGYREDVNKLINISDIGIMMSYREGLPRSLMEFMACGRKIIATNIRGCRDLISNEAIGTLVNVGDYKSTADEIEKYYNSHDKSFNVPEEVNKYDIINVNKELAKIYRSISGEINCEKGISSYLSSI